MNEGRPQFGQLPEVATPHGTQPFGLLSLTIWGEAHTLQLPVDKGRYLRVRPVGPSSYSPGMATTDVRSDADACDRDASTRESDGPDPSRGGAERVLATRHGRDDNQVFVRQLARAIARS